MIHRIFIVGRQYLSVLLVIGTAAGIFLGVGHVHAQSAERGQAAYDAGDFVTAFEQWLPLAELGDMNMQNSIGALYEQGMGVRQDLNEARRWYTRAAEQGHDFAQQNLRALETHVAEYERYLRLAEQGDRNAQYEVGRAERDGIGTLRDLNSAIRWFRAAADQEVTAAMVAVGLMYDFGLGVSIDYGQAVYWYRLAADRGDADGQHNLAVMYIEGLGVQPNLEQAAEWLKLAAEQGHMQSQLKLANLYFHGTGVEQDRAEAARWYHRAFIRGSDDARRYLQHIEENFPSDARSGLMQGKINRSFTVIFSCAGEFGAGMEVQLARYLAESFFDDGDRYVYQLTSPNFSRYCSSLNTPSGEAALSRGYLEFVDTRVLRSGSWQDFFIVHGFDGGQISIGVIMDYERQL